MLIDAHPSAYNALSNRLYIGVSLLGDDGAYRFVWKHRFKDNADLCHSLLSGFHIPFLCRYDATVEGVCAVDGAVAFDESRHLPEDTLRIGIVHELLPRQRSFYHISTCVSVRTLLHPMVDVDRRALYHRVRNDAHAFLTTHVQHHGQPHPPSSPQFQLHAMGGVFERARQVVLRALLMKMFEWLRRRQPAHVQFSKQTIARVIRTSSSCHGDMIRHMNSGRSLTGPTSDLHECLDSPECG